MGSYPSLIANMTTNYINLKLPESDRAFDLVGMQIDLDKCKELCIEYLKHAEKLNECGNKTQVIDDECYVTTILVKYARCFKSGVRSRVQKELSATISKSDLPLHDLAINIRDKHIAHSVNDLEEHRVRVYLHPPERGKGLGSVNLESHRMVAPELEFFRKLLELICEHLDWISKQKYEELQRLQKIVGEKYTLDELYEMNVAAKPEMSFDNIAKSRKNSNKQFNQ
jgi:GNAT superfamily N-acetyltransferase